MNTPPHNPPTPAGNKACHNPPARATQVRSKPAEPSRHGAFDVRADGPDPRAELVQTDDDLTLLLAVGLDPVGDVQIVPAGQRPTPAESLVCVDKAFDAGTFSEILEAAGVIDPVALAGVQDKASARMISVPVGQAGAWLTGNGDVHAKNISILATPTGEWRVSPAYDLPSTLPYRDYTLALAMLGKQDGLSRGTLLAFADAVGVPARAAARTLEVVLAATETIPDELAAGALPFASQITKQWVRSLQNRRRNVL